MTTGRVGRTLPSLSLHRSGLPTMTPEVRHQSALPPAPSAAWHSRRYGDCRACPQLPRFTACRQARRGAGGLQGHTPPKEAPFPAREVPTYLVRRALRTPAELGLVSESRPGHSLGKSLGKWNRDGPPMGRDDERNRTIHHRGTDPAVVGAPGMTPRGSVDRRATSAPDRHAPIDFVAENEPVMNPNVAVVLARIVRCLRERERRKVA